MTKLDTSYTSELYFDVVLKNKPYKGWTCTYVGNGTIVFVHNDGEEFKVTKGILCTTWDEECWNDFLWMIERLEEGL
jgi:hypothetical protein